MSQALPMAIGPALATSLFAATIGKEVVQVQFVWMILFIIRELGFFQW